MLFVEVIKKHEMSGKFKTMPELKVDKQTLSALTKSSILEDFSVSNSIVNI